MLPFKWLVTHDPAAAVIAPTAAAAGAPDGYCLQVMGIAGIPAGIAADLWHVMRCTATPGQMRPTFLPALFVVPLPHLSCKHSLQDWHCSADDASVL
jgi:hypothetical protein